MTIISENITSVRIERGSDILFELKQCEWMFETGFQGKILTVIEVFIKHCHSNRYDRILIRPRRATKDFKQSEDSIEF